ncbi:MAG: hypothetical protein ABEJ25_00650 [Candidatus Bipolaricaulia bacterium]
MSKKSVLLVGIVLIITLLFLTNFARAGEIEDKLSRVIRLKLGLDSEVYRVVETEYQGTPVVLVVIFGNKKALNSSLGSDIKAGLKKYESETPVAISVLTKKSDAKFRPYALRIIQNGQSTRANKIVGITEGFKEGKMPEKVPIAGKVFWGSKGIITLGSSFDPTTPFKIKYGATSANFALSSTKQKATKPEASELTNQKSKDVSSEEMEEGKATEDKDLNSPPVSEKSSKTGQGLALLAQLGTLLAVTFSLL